MSCAKRVDDCAAFPVPATLISTLDLLWESECLVRVRDLARMWPFVAKRADNRKDPRAPALIIASSLRYVRLACCYYCNGKLDLSLVNRKRPISDSD